MALFEVTPYDRRIYEEELKDFLPQKILDVHTHVWLDKYLDHKPLAPGEVKRTVTWPSLVALDNSIEDLQETYRLMLPGKDVTALMFTSRGAWDKNNAYVAECSRRTGFPALYYSRPEQSPEELEQEIRLVFSDLSTIVREYEGSVDWIESLKARGYHTYYLSNYGERIRREASKELSFLSHMDGGIMSYTVHLAKPDPAIYQTLLDRYGLKAEECVFLDDTVRNVEAAQALGIAGIVVTSQEQAKKELETLL